MKIKISLSYLRIIIVVFAIGLLANTIGPVSSQAAIERNTHKLIGELVKMRANLQLYRVHHKGLYPPTNSFANFQVELRTKDKSNAWYIKKIPTNPFNGLNTVRFDKEPAGANKAGWKFDAETGDFQADNDPAYSAL